MSRYTQKKQKLTTHEGGKQYKLSPMLNLRLITASSILGEPKFYNEDSNSVFEMFNDAIDKALDYDFKGTLDFAQQLRHTYNMRLNPNFILIKALMHKNRQKFNQDNPGVMKKALENIIMIPSDIKDQYDLYTYINNGIKGLPTMLKKAWSNRLSCYSKYILKKYMNKCRLIDMVRLSHAHSEYIDEMMQTGDIVTDDKDKTWETLRASGLTWQNIIKQIKLPHMALLSNLRGILSEIDDIEIISQLGKQLVNGVANGKQFPFKYYAAYREIDNDLDNEHAKKIIKDYLSQCMNESLKNLPHLKGKTVALSDNSGSTDDHISSHSVMRIRDVDNISALLCAMNSDDGEVVYFSHYYEYFKLNNKPFFEQLEYMNSKNVDGGTNNALAEYLEKAIVENIHVDNLFCFTDDQSMAYKYNESKIIKRYRETVNPKINIFLVQTAGYMHGTMPENGYRQSYLTGWTGKECLFASELIKIWDEMDLAV